MNPCTAHVNVRVIYLNLPMRAFFLLHSLLPILASTCWSNTFGQRAMALHEMEQILIKLVGVLEVDNISEFLAITMTFRKHQKTMDTLCSPTTPVFTDFTCIDRRRVEKNIVRLFEAALPAVMALQKHRLNRLARYLECLKLRLKQTMIDIGEFRQVPSRSPTKGTELSPRAQSQKAFDETETILTMVAQYVTQIRCYTRLFSVSAEEMKIIVTVEGETKDVCNEILLVRNNFIGFVTMFGGDEDDTPPCKQPLDTIHEVDDT